MDCAEGKNNLSEAERQVKRLEAANRRRQQVEKAARDIQVPHNLHVALESLLIPCDQV